MKLKRTIIALSLLVAGSALGAGWGSQTRITGYYVYEDGAAYFTTENNLNPDSCQNPQYLALDSTKSNFKAIWAQVIAAHTTNSTVTPYYAGCLGAYPRIVALAVPNVW